ncbi:MAG: hypothetical protein IJI07_10730 [Flexilinea sp.]|nr:hypothetical protein [Flexilinea sp.]
MEKFLMILILCLVISLPAAVVAAPGYYEQLDLIAENADLWKQEMEYGLWGYTVTDLDQNGRLEIISASLQGTGMYTIIQIFEVDPEGTALSEVMQDRPEYESAPDIMLDTAPAFYDPETEVYYYIFTDYIRNGYAESYENKRAVWLAEGIWEEIPLVNKNTVCTDIESCTDSYTDPEGNVISEEVYENAEDLCFDGYEKGILRLNWNMTDSESFAQMTMKELRDALENVSYAEPAGNF